MLFLGVLKRVVPFFLTFAAGLFIASFFINLSAPSSFNLPRRTHKHREMRWLRDENRELRRANQELRRQLEEARSNSEVRFAFENPVPPEPPPPPPPLKHPRVNR
ncbi:MAG: hypothetical protein AB7F88_11005 [Pyrinomonadaceae bacterium]